MLNKNLVGANLAKHLVSASDQWTDSIIKSKVGLSYDNFLDQGVLKLKRDTVHWYGLLFFTWSGKSVY